MRNFQHSMLRFMAAVSIGVIAALVISARAESSPDPVVRAQADIEAISTMLKLYQAMNGFLPTTEQGLQALVTEPKTDPKPSQWRKLLDRLPLDPWANPYLYVQPGKRHPDAYDLSSAGPDGRPNTADDITN